jgi:4-hydroxy-tetrahydrodipicolinate reductase
VGVAATNDADALLASDAECVVYTATADLRLLEALDDVCRILRSGKNVVSSSIVPLVHPGHLGPDVEKRLVDACREGNASFWTSGIDPGFANDLLPLTLSGLCERWTQIRIQEIVNYATYDQPEVVLGTMGFGKPMDELPLLLLPGSLTLAWGGTIRILAEGLGVELDEITQWYECLPDDGLERSSGSEGADVQFVDDSRPKRCLLEAFIRPLEVSKVDPTRGTVHALGLKLRPRIRPQRSAIE